MTSQTLDVGISSLISKFQAVRSLTASIAAPLSAEDQMIQSCPEASPVKWHQAHTTWFFEAFVLRLFMPDYEILCVDFRWLFNSYYNSLGEVIPEKKLRASFSRPSLDEITAFRSHVDSEMERFLSRPIDDEATRRIILGLNHEQQHQELGLTDIKHAFFTNPLHPSYSPSPLPEGNKLPIPELQWHSFKGGLIESGCPLETENPLEFCFDNETPRHKVFLEPFQIANREITCGEYLEFISAGAYTRPEFWLSAGWDTVKATGWQAPLYWQRDDADATGWRVFTLSGWSGLSALLAVPVCHISFFEADAYARWKGCRLPTEAEWEFVASQSPSLNGNLLDTGRLHPAKARGTGIVQLFGDCWEWTASPYTGYPGYKPLQGALGEYNGKFMSGQMVLRGGSCVTPPKHIRATYRNFFHPEIRWQFTGLRLAI
ncbi:MAG TPA: ergothioneine biosynthesis protein EgtB [Tepidisphaeraceae bacterium]|jgi:ergothioneine biosynthesis protein EgtB|nr:ergothioneine biosynthesis protein EgtB [Tepidisphaeraceae bacterium]